MHFPLKLKNIVLISILLFFTVIIVSFYCSSLQEGFKGKNKNKDNDKDKNKNKDKDNHKEGITNKSSESSVTLTTSQVNSFVTGLSDLQTSFTNDTSNNTILVSQINKYKSNLDSLRGKLISMNTTSESTSDASKNKVSTSDASNNST